MLQTPTWDPFKHVRWGGLQQQLTAFNRYVLLQSRGVVGVLDTPKSNQKYIKKLSLKFKHCSKDATSGGKGK